MDPDNSRMAARNVDENIYHWKILNVSIICLALILIPVLNIKRVISRRPLE